LPVAGVEYKYLISCLDNFVFEIYRGPFAEQPAMPWQQFSSELVAGRF